MKLNDNTIVKIVYLVLKNTQHMSGKRKSALNVYTYQRIPHEKDAWNLNFTIDSFGCWDNTTVNAYPFL